MLKIFLMENEEGVQLISRLKIGIASNLRRIRQRKNMKLQQVADAVRNKHVRLDHTYLSQIERGIAELPLRTLLALSEYYEIPPAILFPDSERNPGADFIQNSVDLMNSLQSLHQKVGEEAAREILRRELTRLLKSLEVYRNREPEAK